MVKGRARNANAVAVNMRESVSRDDVEDHEDEASCFVKAPGRCYTPTTPEAFSQYKQRVTQHVTSGTFTNLYFAGGDVNNRDDVPHDLGHALVEGHAELVADYYGRSCWTICGLTGHAREVFYQFMRMSWIKLFPLFILVYVVVNLGFAWIYAWDPDHCVRSHERWDDAIWFSSQTLTTVGYGRLEGKSFLCQFIAGFEAIFGILLTGMLAGVIYTKISIPFTDLIFSNVLCVQPGTKSNPRQKVALRLYNPRGMTLFDVQFKMTLWYNAHDPVTGSAVHRQRDLQLNSNGIFPVWYGHTTLNIWHYVDDNSALLEVDPVIDHNHHATGIRHDPERIVVTVNVLNPAFAANTVNMFQYIPEHIRSNQVLNELRTPEKPLTDLSQFHQCHKVQMIPEEETDAASQEPQAQVGATRGDGLSCLG